MDVATPYADVMPGLEGPVLEVLASTTRPLTGRQVQARSRRGGVPGVAATLNRLVRSGLVIAEPAGRAILYRANRDHVAWPVVGAAMELRAELVRRIARRIQDWEEPPARAVLFGSGARGDGDAESDVDILLVRASGRRVDQLWQSLTYELVEDIRRWTGNEAQIIDVDEAAWRRMTNESDPLAASVNADGVDLLSQTWSASA